MKETRVLIIDDDQENVRYLTTILEENGFSDIHSAHDGEEGLEKVHQVKPGLILLDLRMPKKSGIFVFNELKASETTRDIPVIILTGEGGFLKHLAELRSFHEDFKGVDEKATEEVLTRFITSRPDAFLEKPIEPNPFMGAVRQVLITLDEVKANRCAEINALREKKLAQGVVYKGLPFASDEQSRSHLTAVAAAVASGNGKGLDKDLAWRSSDNQLVSMSKEDLLAFHGTLTRWVCLNYKASWDLKDAVCDLGSIGDVESFDIQQRWPDPNI
jgi:CheY-like chemotaxis protein